MSKKCVMELATVDLSRIIQDGYHVIKIPMKVLQRSPRVGEVREYQISELLQRLRSVNVEAAELEQIVERLVFVLQKVWLEVLLEGRGLKQKILI
jgi:hypothetical protein